MPRANRPALEYIAARMLDILGNNSCSSAETANWEPSAAG